MISFPRSFFIYLALIVWINRRIAPVGFVTKSVPKHPWASSFCSGSLNLSGVYFHYETVQWDCAGKWKGVFGGDNDLKHKVVITAQHSGVPYLLE